MHLHSLVTLAGLILIVLFVTLRYRKQIRLFLVQQVYGRYSFEFFHLYKRFFIRSPFQYCFRDEFISHLLFALDPNSDRNTYKSLKEIRFEETPYFISYKEFLKEKGAPDCFNAFQNTKPDFIIKALGYYRLIMGSKAVLVFYFMNDLFFMGEYIFKNPKTDIKESLLSHFIEGKNIDSDNFYIENTMKRFVHFQDTGFTVDIKYLTRESEEINDNLGTYLNQVRNKKLIQEP